MIFDYLNFKNKFQVEKFENSVIIKDTENSNIAVKILTFENSEILTFEIFITENYLNIITDIVYNELIKIFKNSGTTILETIVNPNNPYIEYLHSHNFQMMSVDNKFKLTYKPRRSYEF